VSTIDNETLSVVNEVIQALVKSREFLGVQLSHARGSVSEKYFYPSRAENSVLQGGYVERSHR